MGRRGRGFGRRMGKVAGRQGGNRKQGGLPQVIRERLKAAKAELDGGNPDGAVEILSGLADKASERGRHGMAVQMAVLATSALARSGRTADAVEWSQKAAQFGGPIQNQTKVARRFGRLCTALKEAGHGEAADAIEAAAIDALGVSKLPAASTVTVNRARRRMLPKVCQACGTKVDAARVEFDEEGADCPACGNELT